MLCQTSALACHVFSLSSASKTLDHRGRGRPGEHFGLPSASQSAVRIIATTTPPYPTGLRGCTNYLLPHIPTPFVPSGVRAQYTTRDRPFPNCCLSDGILPCLTPPPFPLNSVKLSAHPTATVEYVPPRAATSRPPIDRRATRRGLSIAINCHRPASQAAYTTPPSIVYASATQPPS